MDEGDADGKGGRMSYTFIYECRSCDRNCTVDKAGCSPEDIDLHRPEGCTFGSVKGVEWEYVDHYKDDVPADD